MKNNIWRVLGSPEIKNTKGNELLFFLNNKCINRERVQPTAERLPTSAQEEKHQQLEQRLPI